MSVLSEPKFDQHCRDAVLGLRAALLELYREVKADPTAPQDVARRFSLNKNLSWKISRILQSEDALAAVPNIPGNSGLTILLDAMKNAGAPESSIMRVQAASRAFERMVDTHTGDRAGLELTLDSMGGEGAALERSRRLAFQGNSGIWGIQCQTRLAAQFVAPSHDDPDLLDLAFVAGWQGVRRLRPIDRWPAFQIFLRHDDGTDISDNSNNLPLAPDKNGGSWMLNEFCTGAMPEMHSRRAPNGICYEFGDGPVGRTGEFGCFYGNLRPMVVSRYASKKDTLGEFHVGITIPAAVLLFDIFVHRDLPEALAPEVLVRGRLQTHFDYQDHSLIRLPVRTRVHDLGRNPSVATPLVNGYDRLINTAMTAGGWELTEFHCLRLILEYPPMPSTVTMQYQLPEANKTR